MEEKINLYKILNDKSVEQYPELSVVGWIDNNEKYLKISGIIDLLYNYKNEWFILDYKTDSDMMSLEKYKIQIQTYQWIVRQLFNIEAKGQIYFSAFNKLISIDWRDEYFSKIFPEENDPFSMTKFSALMNLSAIKKIILKEKGENILIINYTKYQSENMKRQLSNEKLLSPNIKIKNLNELVREQIVNEKKLSPSLLRLAVSTIVNDDEKRGTIRALSDAISENEKYQDEIVNFQDSKIVEKFNKLKSEKKLVTSSDVLKSFLNNYDFSGSIVILNGIFEISDEKFDLFKQISKRSKKFYFIDNFENNSIKENFNYDLSVWNKKVYLPKEKAEQVCKICYSIYEEVDQLANDILSIPDWKNQIDKIKITVSSMNRYLPILKNVFSEYGIPIRFIAGNSLLEFPITQLILKVVKLMKSQENWQDVKDVIFDPFMMNGEEYFAFDKWVRGNGIEKYLQIEDKISSEEKKIFEEIKQFIAENIKVKNNLFSIENKLVEFVEKFKLIERLENDEQSIKILKKVLKIAKTISENYSIMGLKGNIDDFAIDLKERLKEETIVVNEQKYGFELLGFFDTIHLQADKLFVLGMTENDFPLMKIGNPFIKQDSNFRFKREIHLLNQWIKLGDKVQYYSSERDANGDVLQPSTFLEYANVQKVNEVSNKSRRSHYLKYYGKKIISDEKKNIIDRHNDYLGNGNKNYLGKTETDFNSQLFFTASSMDDLLKCPMRYWFGHKLHLKSIDVPSEKEADLGNVIHSVLEEFGNDKGFEIAKNDKKKAIEKMAKIFENNIKKSNIDLKNDLLLNNSYKNFSDDLIEDGNNLFVNLINWNIEKFSKFDYKDFETEFKGEVEFDNRKINLKIRIDKILKNEEQNMVVATDYKTGIVEKTDTKKMLSSQFILYYLALKKLYPNKDIVLVYEQLKSLKDKENGFSKFYGDVKNQQQFGKKIVKFVTDENNEQNNSDIILYKVMKFYFEQIDKVKRGEYFITDRPDKNACKYCEFDKICRKNSLFENNKRE